MERHIHVNTVGDLLVTQVVTFELREKASSMTLTIQSTGRMWGTGALYDPHGQLRGQLLLLGESKTWTIAEQAKYASAATVWGPLKLGEWRLDLQASSSEASELTLSVSLNSQELVENDYVPLLGEDYTLLAYLAQQDIKQQVTSQQRWYKGDFHTHTTSSDGQMSMSDNNMMASKQGLDFYVATDHNIVPTLWNIEEGPMVYPGIEVTSTLGHANLLWVDRLVFDSIPIAEYENEQGFIDMFTYFKAHALISINHPYLTVWRWLVKSLPMNLIDTIEICNDPTYSDNQLATEWALAFWYAALNAGYSITAIGGSDSHLRPEETYPGSQEPSLIGDPATYVWAENGGPSALKEAVKAGRVVVARFGQLTVDWAGYLPGETVINWGENDTFTFTAKYEVAPAYADKICQLHYDLLLDGELVSSQSMVEKAAFMIKGDKLSGGYHWATVKVSCDAYGFIAISNPLFWGVKTPELISWQQVEDSIEMDGFNDDSSRGV